MNINDVSTNHQVTDAVTKINTLLAGSAAPQSMGLLDIASAETIGMSMYNAVSAQHNAQISASASVTSACARMLQAKMPVAEKNKEEDKAPPPFMPLDTKPLSAQELLSKADQLAKQAMSMLDKNSNEAQEDQKQVDSLLSQIKKYLQTDEQEESGTSEKTSK